MDLYSRKLLRGKYGEETLIHQNQPKALVGAKPSQMTWVNATRIRERSPSDIRYGLALVFAPWRQQQSHSDGGDGHTI